MSSEFCLILHRKSANEPAVKEAVKYVRGKGIDLVSGPLDNEAEQLPDCRIVIHNPDQPVVGHGALSLSRRSLKGEVRTVARKRRNVGVTPARPEIRSRTGPPVKAEA